VRARIATLCGRFFRGQQSGGRTGRGTACAGEGQRGQRDGRGAASGAATGAARGQHGGRAGRVELGPGVAGGQHRARPGGHSRVRVRGSSGVTHTRTGGSMTVRGSPGRGWRVARCGGAGRRARTVRGCQGGRCEAVGARIGPHREGVAVRADAGGMGGRVPLVVGASCQGRPHVERQTKHDDGA
jgi:hypothetical protein